MEGRDTPSRGLELTAKFLALNLSRWGLKPAGDNGTFFQRIPLRTRSWLPVRRQLWQEDARSRLELTTLHGSTMAGPPVRWSSLATVTVLVRTLPEGHRSIPRS
jgi:hypothetical protein